MKKLASLILALAMCLALAAPAFATSASGNMSTELSSLLPELSVTLPESATIILNPYRNAVADDVANAATGIDKGDRLQVMNAVFSVVSNTLNKLHVSAVVTGKVGGTTEFATAAVAPGAAGHKVNLTLTYVTASGTTATVPVPDKVTSPTNVKVISDSEQTLTWDLPAATKSSGTVTPKRLDLQFGGTCSDSPSADDGPWKDSDTVSATFVFTVTPIADDPMLTAMYKAGGNATTPTHSNFEVTTTKPSDYKELPTDSVGISKIEYRLTSAATFTELSKGSDNWGGSSWDGNKITLNSTKCGDVLGVASAVKLVKFTLEYKDKAGDVQNPTYTVKVTVLPVDPA